MYSKINWHVEMHPREHDASVLAFIMRMRAGHKSQDFFGARHLLLTRNGMLSQMARRFCLNYELINQKQLPPIVHQRQLATALWLRTGLGTVSDEPPKRYVLAACERVLELKKSVVESVKSARRNLTREQADQLDLLLTQDRSVQLLKDKTLNSSAVITSDNIGCLVDAMKAEFSAEERERANRAIKQAKKEARQKIKEKNVELETMKSEKKSMESELSSRQLEDMRAVQNVIDLANSYSTTERRIVYVIIYMFLGLVALVPLILEFVNGWWRFVPLVISIPLALSLMERQIRGKHTDLDLILARRAEKKLAQLVRKRGIEPKLGRFRVQWVPKKQTFEVSHGSNDGGRSDLFAS